MYHWFQNGLVGRSPTAFGWASGSGRFDTGVASVEDGARIVGEECEGGAGIRFLRCRRWGWGMPGEGRAIVDPEVREVAGLLGCVLEAAVEDDIVLCTKP